MKTLNLSQNALEIRGIIEQFQKSTEFLKLTSGLTKKPESIAGLVELVASEDVYPFPQYASHLLLHIAWEHPAVLEAHYEALFDCVLSTKNPSIRRNLLGVLNAFELREYREGELLDWLLANLSDPSSKPGVINYSVRKLTHYVERYPELINEIETAIALREELGMQNGLTQWSKTVLKKAKATRFTRF